MLDTFADLSPARVVQGLSRPARRNPGSEPLTIETRWQAHGRFGKCIYIMLYRHFPSSCAPHKIEKVSMHKILELSLINSFFFQFSIALREFGF